MHAVASTVSIEDPRVAREPLTDLRLELVPRAPGFVSACWLDADQAAAYPVPPLPGVTLLTLDIREVYASA